jgi:hypothetical protein
MRTSHLDPPDAGGWGIRRAPRVPAALTIPEFGSESEDGGEDPPPPPDDQQKDCDQRGEKTGKDCVLRWNTDHYYCQCSDFQEVVVTAKPDPPAPPPPPPPPPPDLEPPVFNPGVPPVILGGGDDDDLNLGPTSHSDWGGDLVCTGRAPSAADSAECARQCDAQGQDTAGCLLRLNRGTGKCDPVGQCVPKGENPDK